MARSKPSSPHRWPTRSIARMPLLNPAKWSSFRRAHLPSTCSKVTLTAAINSALSSKPCPNEKEVQNAKAVQTQTQETPRHRCAPAASHDRERGRLRRHRRTADETLATVLDRPPPPPPRSGRDPRL